MEKAQYLALAQLISRYHLSILKKEDYDSSSSIEFEYNGKIDKWTEKDGWWSSNIFPNSISFNGLYEESLFYGTRFNDSRAIDNLLATGKIQQKDIVDSDLYIKEKLSYILHGDYSHYTNLKRIRNKYITEKLGLSNSPYFNSVKATLISQYRMSSGECLLISLLHFVYNSIVRKSLPPNKKILVLIDEIELALHPIAVSRLLDLLKELIKDSANLVVILTTHSPEVIRKIKPSNLYKVTNNSGQLIIESNCYPSYLIRDVYSHDGFDYLLLVEDILTRTVVEKILNQEHLKNSKLIHIVPVGGWTNVLNLHRELLMWNVLGLGKQIVSILDGDIVDLVNEEYKDLRKLFLPIKSVEKYLYDVII
ncbi:AAA family ATPase [Mucilaginibacter terrae]|uniref:AAA family ATPase n=1 Tax=Mucilaginibacter terrae TaxID=1955052 RepID=UPI00362F2E68